MNNRKYHRLLMSPSTCFVYLLSTWYLQVLPHRRWVHLQDTPKPLLQDGLKPLTNRALKHLGSNKEPVDLPN